MRRPRNFQTDRCYHLISRVAHRAFYLNDEERTRFVERMRRVAYFSCIEILAYCVPAQSLDAAQFTNGVRPRAVPPYRLTAKGRRALA